MAERIVDGIRFRSIAGFSRYEIGEDGTVLSWCALGRVARRRALSPTAMQPNRIGRGYLAVILSDDNGRLRSRYVHRLVLEAFVGPCPPGMEACHEPDTNPANNALLNLRWDTHVSNNRDKRNHGTDPIGERNGAANLTEEQVSEIKRRLASGELSVAIARDFGVDHRHIGNIKQLRVWKHVLPELNDKIILERRLTEDEILAIRQRGIGAKYGMKRILAKEFGVSEGTVYRLTGRKLITT